MSEEKEEEIDLSAALQKATEKAIAEHEPVYTAQQKKNKGFTTCVKIEYDRNGKELGRKFKPTASMRVWAQVRSNPVHAKKSDGELARELGYERSPISLWKYRLGPEAVELFEDWLEEEMERARAPIRDMLLSVGREMASNGDYNFWRDLAKTHGVVAPEQIEQKISLGKLADNYDNMTEEQLLAEQRKLLQATRAVEHGGADAMAEEISVGGQASPGPGDPALPT